MFKQTRLSIRSYLSVGRSCWQIIAGYLRQFCVLVEGSTICIMLENRNCWTSFYFDISDHIDILIGLVSAFRYFSIDIRFGCFYLMIHVLTECPNYFKWSLEAWWI